jgi:hypothetical protein
MKNCHLNDQIIDNQIYLINSTKNTISSQFTTGTHIWSAPWPWDRLSP